MLDHLIPKIGKQVGRLTIIIT